MIIRKGNCDTKKKKIILRCYIVASKFSSRGDPCSTVSDEPTAEKDSYWLTSSSGGLDDDWPPAVTKVFASTLVSWGSLLGSHGPLTSACTVYTLSYTDTVAMWSIIRRLHYLSVRACKSEQYAIEYVKVFVIVPVFWPMEKKGEKRKIWFT